MDEILNKILRNDDETYNADQDLHVHTRKNPKYHSLMGKNQHPVRNKDTIKMSSGSAAVNVYRNMQTKDIVDHVGKNEFDKN